MGSARSGMSMVSGLMGTCEGGALGMFYWLVISAWLILAEWSHPRLSMGRPVSPAVYGDAINDWKDFSCVWSFPSNKRVSHMRNGQRYGYGGILCSDRSPTQLGCRLLMSLALQYREVTCIGHSAEFGFAGYCFLCFAVYQGKTAVLWPTLNSWIVPRTELAAASRFYGSPSFSTLSLLLLPNTLRRTIFRLLNDIL